MNGNDALHIELQALNVVEKAQVVRARRIRRGRRRCRRIVAIGLEQHLLLREIRDEHSVVVKEIPQVVELDDARAVGQHFLVANRLDLWLLPGELRCVRIQRVRRAQNFFEIGLVHPVREDGRPFGDERAEAAGVIDMAMGVDHVPDGFVWNQAPGLGDHGQCARPILPRLDERDVVLEIDRDYRVAAGDQVNAVTELL